MLSSLPSFRQLESWRPWTLHLGRADCQLCTKHTGWTYLVNLVSLSHMDERSVSTARQISCKGGEEMTYTPSSKPGPTLKALTFSASILANLS